MTWLLVIILVLLVLGALVSLIRGVIGMAQNTDPTGQRSQNLMQKRVLFQAAAILVAVLLLLIAGGRH
jgi:NADH:ubiquinone oxidoreductase subunit 6 (subunit J)